MTHEDLRVLAVRYAKTLKHVRDIGRYGFGCSVIASEVYTAANDIPDVIGWRMGFSYMIECKASRSDFFADRKKKQRNSGTGVGNYRYFMAPAGMICADELPENWGLIEVNGKAPSITVQCELRELDNAAHREEKRILLSLLRRIKQREFLIIQDDRTDALEDEHHVGKG